MRRMNEDEGTWLGHVLEHVAIELQCLAGTPVTFGKTRGEGLPKGQYHVVYSYVEEEVGLAAGDLALRILRHLLPPERADHDPSPFDFDAELEELVRLAQRRALGPSTAALVQRRRGAGHPLDPPQRGLAGAARLRQAPEAHPGDRHQRDPPDRHRDRLRQAADPPASSSSSACRCPGRRSSTTPTRRWRRRSGSASRWSSSRSTATTARRWRSTSRPRSRCATAYEKARELCRRVIVEACQSGNDHRILVVDGSVVAVAQRVPGHVVGDGEHTIAELIDVVNGDPRRGIGHEKVLTRLEVDDQARRLLAARRAARSTRCSPAGEVFYLRSTGNLSTGGTAIDTTDVDPRRQPADGRAGRQGDRPRRRRRRLHLARHLPQLPRGGRRHRRGQRRARLPHAPGAHRGQAARRGRAGDRHALPARHPLPHPDRRDHRHQRQDHHHPHGRAHPQARRPHGGHGDHRRRLHRRRAHRPRRHDRPLVEPAGAPRSRRSTPPCSRPRAAASSAPASAGASATSARCSTSPPTTSASAASRTWRTSPRSSRSSSRWPQDYCVLNADDERVAAMAAASPAEPIYVTLDHKNELVREHVRAKGEGGGAGGGPERPDDHPLPGRAADPAAAGRARSPRRIEGKALHNVQNAMFAAAIAHGMGVGGGEHPPGAAHLLERLLPGAGAAQLLQRAPVPGAPRLRPQRPRHGGGGADGARARRPRPAHRRDRLARRPPRRGHPRPGAAPPRPPSTSSCCARTTTCAAAGPARWPTCCARASLDAGFPAERIVPGFFSRGGVGPRRRWRWPAPATWWSSSATTSPASGSRSSASSPRAAMTGSRRRVPLGELVGAAAVGLALEAALRPGITSSTASRWLCTSRISRSPGRARRAPAGPPPAPSRRARSASVGTPARISSSSRISGTSPSGRPRSISGSSLRMMRSASKGRAARARSRRACVVAVAGLPEHQQPALRRGASARRRAAPRGRGGCGRSRAGCGRRRARTRWRARGCPRGLLPTRRSPFAIASAGMPIAAARAIAARALATLCRAAPPKVTGASVGAQDLDPLIPRGPAPGTPPASQARLAARRQRPGAPAGLSASRLNQTMGAREPAAAAATSIGVVGVEHDPPLAVPRPGRPPAWPRRATAGRRSRTRPGGRRRCW